MMNDDDDNNSGPAVQLPDALTDQMSDEQRARIDKMQESIDAIWSKKGNYKIDDDAWRSMPAFMGEITEKDVIENDACAALANLAYDNLSSNEIAEDLKKRGNHNLSLALNPEQVNRANVARGAKHFYTEALDHKPTDRKLCCVLYSNRCQANIIMQNFGHGLEDAQRAIVLDPGYAKSYYRGALCAMRINKFEIAEKFLAHALSGDKFVEAAKASFSSAEAVAAVQQIPDDQLLHLRKLAEEVAAAKQSYVTRVQRIQREARAGKAEKSNILRRMQTYGIKIASKMEVSSEQWEQYGKAKPYFEKLESKEPPKKQQGAAAEATAVGPAQQTELLHVPLLLLWDEASQSDFLHDVPVSACMYDVLSEVLPPPWNDYVGEGRYSKADNLICFFKIDDGVKMPEHYSFDPSWELWEVMRSAQYVMPGLVPTVHLVPKDSKLLEQFNLVPLKAQ